MRFDSSSFFLPFIVKLSDFLFFFRLSDSIPFIFFPFICCSSKFLPFCIDLASELSRPTLLFPSFNQLCTPNHDTNLRFLFELDRKLHIMELVLQVHTSNRRLENPKHYHGPLQYIKAHIRDTAIKNGLKSSICDSSHQVLNGLAKFGPRN